MFISIATAVANNRTVNVQSDPIRDKKIYSTLYYSTIIVNEYCRRSNPSANKLRNIFNVKLLSLSRRDENCSRIEEKKQRERGEGERERERGIQANERRGVEHCRFNESREKSFIWGRHSSQSALYGFSRLSDGSGLIHIFISLESSVESRAR